jgi:hypothetical protein
MLNRPTITDRRTFLRALGAGSVVTALGGAAYVLADDAETERARQTKRADGRVRLPPSQYLLKRMRPMGGEAIRRPTSSSKVHGEVDAPFSRFRGALKLTIRPSATYCVTKWSLLDAKWTGVRVAALAGNDWGQARARRLLTYGGYTATSITEAERDAHK